jgi:hypothetical protein
MLFNSLLYLQRHLHQIAVCARAFGTVLELADIDLSIFQDAVSTGATSAALHQYIPNAVAYLCETMSSGQREWTGFERWYLEMMDHGVFGTEDDPIVIAE